MIRLAGFAVLATALLASPAAAQRSRTPPPSPINPALGAATPDVMSGAMAFLNDSLLRGRLPGTMGGALAARFIAAQFQSMGLAPGGPGGAYLQPVPLLRVRAKVTAVFGAGRETPALKMPDDLVIWPLTTDSLFSMDGEIVFAGYGIEAPEFGWDDYKGVPQAGRIVMVLAGDHGMQDSAAYGGRKRPRYGHWSYKVEQAAKTGAAGIILVHTTAATGASFSRVAGPFAGERLWLGPATAGTSLKFAGWVREETARALLQAAGRDYQLLVRRARQAEFSPLVTGIHAAVDIDTDVSRAQGFNVVGRVEGSDSSARTEPVVIAAPYVRTESDLAFWRDSGSSNADEAQAVATILAAAAGAARIQPAARRPIVFLATAGRVGATQFLAQTRDRIVTTLYVEGAPPKSAGSQVVLGIDRTSLRDVAIGAGQAEGVVLDTETGSEADFFTSGVGAYALGAGPASAFRPDGRPGTARLLLRLAWVVANSPLFPAWLPGFDPVQPARRPSGR